MKKKLFTLACAVVMTMAMGITAVAAPSPSAIAMLEGTVAVVATPEAVTEEVVATYHEITSIEETTVEGATLEPATVAVVQEAVVRAQEMISTNAVVASVVDLVVPEGTGEAEFTLRCSNVRVGMSIHVLHQKSDGSWENVPATAGDGVVTFRLTSYSPVAIIIDTTAPKTGDVAPFVALMAGISLIGLVVFGKKKAL